MTIVRSHGVMVSTQDAESCNPNSNLGGTFSLFFQMPKEIKDFFSKPTSYSDIRREALEKRKKLLEELEITSVCFIILA